MVKLSMAMRDWSHFLCPRCLSSFAYSQCPILDWRASQPRYRSPEGYLYSIASIISFFPSPKCTFKGVDLRMPLRVTIDDLSCTRIPRAIPFWLASSPSNRPLSFFRSSNSGSLVLLFSHICTLAFCIWLCSTDRVIRVPPNLIPLNFFLLEVHIDARSDVLSTLWTHPSRSVVMLEGVEESLYRLCLYPGVTVGFGPHHPVD